MLLNFPTFLYQADPTKDIVQQLLRGIMRYYLRADSRHPIALDILKIMLP